MSSVVVPLNPFSDQIVTSPRRAEPSVQGLNDQALQRLVGAFTAMELPPCRGGRVHLVTSPSGGYGKSHLTGRLYRELGRRATQIYVRPFSDPETCWVSLLHTMIQEMLAPEFTGDEEEEQRDRGPYAPTQLDAFAHGVFASVLIALLDAGEFEYGDPEFVKDRLRNRTFEKWDLGDPRSNWGVWASDMLQRYEESESREARVLRSLNQATGNHLGSTTRPQAWLRVLRRFAGNRGATALRDQCMEWMRARTPMIELVTKPLGLQATDGVDSEGGIAARNSMARSRVLDMLTLGRLFRPFVICFDQTEVFGRVNGLARAFGGMLSDLVQCEGAQFTVVTSNREIWNTQLSPSIEVADRDRIAPPIELVGLSQSQGRELALNRLRETRLPVELQECVLAPDWVTAQFGGGLLSPRDFLRRCEQRYEEVVPAALAQPPRPKLMLAELFAQERNLIEQDPREAKDFRADALRWALLSVPSKAGANFTAKPSRTDVPSYTAEWKGKNGSHRYIVLEPSSHTLVWQAIFRKSQALRGENPNVGVVALRIEGQGAVPQDNQAARVQTNETSSKDVFRVYTLNPGELSKVYAGWELYLQACQGDIDYSPEAVLAFVFDRLVPWYTSLLGEPVASTLAPEQSSSVPTTSVNAAEAPTVILPMTAAPTSSDAPRAEAGAAQPAAAGGLKPSEATAPIARSSIKVGGFADGGSPAAPAPPPPMTFPPPAGLKPVVPMSPQPPLVTAPAPAPVAVTGPSPASSPEAPVSPPAAPAAPPAPAYTAPDVQGSTTEKITIASVSEILAAPAAEPKARHPEAAPAAPLAQFIPPPTGLSAPVTPAPPRPAVPAPRVPAPAAFTVPPPAGFSVPPKPTPPQGPQPSQGMTAPKPGQKAFSAGSPQASTTTAASEQPLPAGVTPPAVAAPTTAPASASPQAAASPPPAGGIPRSGGVTPPPGTGAPSRPAAPVPAPSMKPGVPAPGAVVSPVSRQGGASAVPAAGVTKPGSMPGRPGAPMPAGASSPAARPAAPGAPMSRGPVQPGPRPAPAAPVDDGDAGEKPGFFGRIGKIFSKKEATPPPAPPATPRRPMPAAMAARLAGAVPPGGPPGQQVPVPPPSKSTEAVAVVPVDDGDDSPEAAVRPAEGHPKKSLTEASPAKDASVEDKASATASPESRQGVEASEAAKTAGPAASPSVSAMVAPARVPSATSAPPAESGSERALQPWSFTNEAMTRLAELLHPKNGSTNGHGHASGRPHTTNGHAESPPSEEAPLSQSPSHEAMVWLARCLREYRQERDAPEGSQRVAMFAKEEIQVPVSLIPAAAMPEAASPPSLEKVMRELVKSRRLISYSMLAVELQQRLSRTVTMHEANAAAKASGDIHVYGEGDSAGYLWQGH